MNGGSQVAAVLVARGWGGALQSALRCALSLLALVVIIQALVVVEARPQELMTGIRGMADFIRRAMPPDFSRLPSALWPTLQTIDIALFGTLLGTILATPLAVLAAANVTPSRSAYYAARAIIGFTRAVPDLVWALLFVTAVGLGPFPGGLALGVHSVGMLGRLFAETIEHMNMAPIHALELTGARRIQVFSHGIVPTILPSLLGISLYRLDENTLLARSGFRRRWWHRLSIAHRHEPLPVPGSVDAADHHIRRRPHRRADVGGAAGAARLSSMPGTTLQATPAHCSMNLFAILVRRWRINRLMSLRVRIGGVTTRRGKTRATREW